MSFAQRLDVLANVAIVVVAVGLLGIMYDRYANQGHKREAHEVSVGDVIRLKDVDWSANGTSLILALSTKCHFCTDSAPFYRHMAKRLSESAQKTHILAIFPQTVSEAREYLKGLDVEIADVRQESSSIPIAGTPTLLIVDSRGTVLKKWRGRLHEEEQNLVLRALGQ